MVSFRGRPFSPLFSPGSPAGHSARPFLSVWTRCQASELAVYFFALWSPYCARSPNHARCGTIDLHSSKEACVDLVLLFQFTLLPSVRHNAEKNGIRPLHTACFFSTDDFPPSLGRRGALTGVPSASFLGCVRYIVGIFLNQLLALPAPPVPSLWPDPSTC